MSRIVSVNEFILNPKELNGKRVVTFNDIDLVHGRAEGTARYRFRDNKKHFIEGEDYFVINPQTLENAKLGEKRPIGIESVSVRGTTFVTETGYLMLVKSFTDDLAWQVQRELVNNYFSHRQHTASSEKAERRKVADIPQRMEFQNSFAEMRKKMMALDVVMQNLNRYIPNRDAEAYLNTLDDISCKLFKQANALARTKYNLIPEPY